MLHTLCGAAASTTSVKVSEAARRCAETLAIAAPSVPALEIVLDVLKANLGRERGHARTLTCALSLLEVLITQLPDRDTWTLRPRIEASLMSLKAHGKEEVRAQARQAADAVAAKLGETSMA